MTGSQPPASDPSGGWLPGAPNGEPMAWKQPPMPPAGHLRWSAPPTLCVRCSELITSGEMVTALNGGWTHSACPAVGRFEQRSGAAAPIPHPYPVPPGQQVALPQPAVPQPLPQRQPQTRDGLATAALATAIAGFVIPWAGNLVSVVALVMAGLALGRTAQGSPGRTRAMAGLVVALLGLIVFFW